MRPVSRAIPGFKTDPITHTGPPISSDRMVNVQKTALVDVIRLEGLTGILHRTERLVRRQEVCVGSNHQ